MEQFLQITALCVVGAVLSVAVRRDEPQLSFCLTVGCCVVCLTAASGVISPVLAFLQRLRDMTGLQQTLLAPLLKTVGIGVLTQIAGSFCTEAGAGSLAKLVELCGTFLAVYVSLPLASAVLEMMQTLMGG